jgi:L-aspartate oxidase
MPKSHYETRSRLTRLDVRRVSQTFSDVLIVGAGVAGLRAAIEAARYGDVLVVSKDEVGESNTVYAQGGVAAVMDPPDRFESHIEDTLSAGRGLCNRDAVESIVREAPERMDELIKWGMAFDRAADGRIALGMEGAHSQSRILHADGDSTGKALYECLLAKLKTYPNVRIFENCFVVDLITDEGRCIGAITYHRKYSHQVFWARRTIIASGGAGQLYRETTNPSIATADGHAMGWRAGAAVRDMEMMQFHPTTLYVAGATRVLISEAVRGEGGYLVDREGERFMADYHESGELAPRDVVSRAIVDQMAREGQTNVFLDVRHLGADRFRKRFPRITQFCTDFDIDVGRDLIPVRPSAHYMIGGLITDLQARTSVGGLYACGEAASTGVHGANRLASNSLLEGLVFGRIAGDQAGREAAESSAPFRPPPMVHDITDSRRTVLDLPDIKSSLRSVMWRNVGIERTGDRLAETVEIIDFWGRYVMDKVFDDPTEWEVQNMLTVAWLMTRSAAGRLESRGAHYRSDYPEERDEWRNHFELRRSDA